MILNDSSPDVMPHVRIADIVGPPETWNPASADTDTPFSYIDISSVDALTKSIGDVASIVPSEAPSRARQLVKSGDVLVSTVRPNLNAVAIVPADLDGATASTGFAVLRPNAARVCPRYLFHWVQTLEFVRHLTSRASGASYPAVTETVILESLLPLPSVLEQERIVTILDKADAILRRRRQSLRLLDNFLCSAFLEMFGDPARNEKGWPIERLGDIADFLGGGTPIRARAEFYTGTIPWASSKDFISEDLLDTQEHVTSEAVEESTTHIAAPGSILIVVKSKILLHHLPVAIARTSMCFNQDVKAITLRNRCFSPTFLARHLRVGQQALLNKARGANTEGLTLEHLRDYQVMMPPANLLERWEKIEAGVAGLRSVLGKSHTTSTLLFESVAQRSFLGVSESPQVFRRLS